MKCVGLYFKAFTQKLLSPFYSGISTGVIKVYGSEMDVLICPADSMLKLSLFALLLFHLGSWSLIPLSTTERQN